MSTDSVALLDRDSRARDEECRAWRARTITLRRPGVDGIEAHIDAEPEMALDEPSGAAAVADRLEPLFVCGRGHAVVWNNRPPRRANPGTQVAPAVPVAEVQRQLRRGVDEPLGYSAGDFRAVQLYRRRVCSTERHISTETHRHGLPAKDVHMGADVDAKPDAGKLVLREPPAGSELAVVGEFRKRAVQIQYKTTNWWRDLVLCACRNRTKQQRADCKEKNG